MNTAKLLTTLAASLYFSGFSTGVLGDDIDIFFGSAQQDSQGNPNVLFVLDDSGSMGWDIDDSRNSEKRITVLRRAFRELMSSSGVNNINVGLMQLHGNGNGGQRKVFPVTYIDKDLSAPTPVSPTLTDDASEVSSTVTLDATTLSLHPYNPADPAANPLVALRFTDFQIPKGALIQTAELVLTPANDAANDLTFTVQAENNADSPALSADSTNLSQRPLHGAVATLSSPAQVQKNGEWVDAWKTGKPVTFNHDVSSDGLPVLLTQVVGHDGWCGGNALTLMLKGHSGDGIRTFESREGTALPQLTVTYKGGTGGCIQQEMSFRTSKSNDVHQEDDNRSMSKNSDALQLRAYKSRRVRAERVGLRFTGLPIEPNTQLQDVRLNLNLYDTSIATTLSIRVENTEEADPFNGKNDLKDRYNEGYGTINWSVPAGLEEDTQIQSPDISSLLQKVIDKSDWEAEGDISIIISSSNSELLKITSRDKSQGRAPQLVIKTRGSAAAGSDGSNTVRSHLIGLVDKMIPDSGTPVVRTMMDATNYFRSTESGEWASPIKYACQSNHIVLLTDGEANWPSTDYQNAINALPSTGTGLPGMAAINSKMGHSHCRDDAKVGGKSAEDAIDGEKCGRNLSEWLAVNDLSSTVEDVNSVTLHTIGFAMDANANAKKFMQDMAARNQNCTQAEMEAWEKNPDRSINKSCGFYLSNNASSLVSAFSDIFGSLNDTESTFVTPGATVNQFNRSQHKDEIYFSVFKPSSTYNWPGNVKRYQLKGDSNTTVKVKDLMDQVAVDEDSGFFSAKDPVAHSFWSKKADGNSTEQGGAASRLPATPAARTVYTEINGQLVLIDDLTNSQLEQIANRPEEVAGTLNNDTRSKLINWIKGYAFDGTPKYAMGDPLHSRPSIITYGCSEWDNNDLKRSCKGFTQVDKKPLTRTEYTNSSLFFGSNEGFLHAINTQAQSGQEHFAFIPYELLTNGHLSTWRGNANITDTRAYGLDGSPTIWLNDANRNGVLVGGSTTALDELFKEHPDTKAAYYAPSEDKVNFNEHVYAYIGMRRGGRNYYALDISDINNPSYKWSINGGNGEFKRLGQTWARPIKTRVNIAGDTRDVLFISGGYDESQDQDDPTSGEFDTYQGAYKPNDRMGNAIYMVDAVTGELLWSASSPGDTSRNHNLILNKMNYSIPGNIRAVDLYDDGLADQLFFSDVGGQVWRLYINNGEPLDNLVWAADANGDATSGSDDGVMASLGDPDSIITATDDQATITAKRKGARRFYHEPDIAAYRKNGTRYLAVSIGSGFHSDPMGQRNSDTENRFYMLTTAALYNPNLDYGSIRTAKTVPAQTTLGHGSGTTLVDLTHRLGAKPTDIDLKEMGGWYIQLEPFEFVSAPAISQNEKIYFNTFQKHLTATNPCDNSGGIGRAYQVHMRDATPAVENTSTPDPHCQSGRCYALKSGGIPPETIILKPSDEYEVVCVGSECKSRPRESGYQRNYWKELE